MQRENSLKIFIGWGNAGFTVGMALCSFICDCTQEYLDGHRRIEAPHSMFKRCKFDLLASGTERLEESSSLPRDLRCYLVVLFHTASFDEKSCQGLLLAAK